MLKISRESEINLINVLIDHDIISGKDLPNIKKVSGVVRETLSRIKRQSFPVPVLQLPALETLRSTRR
jgi:hypothetical protein